MSQSERCGCAPLCPSAQPDMAGASVLGVVGGTPEQPAVGYLEEPIPVTPAVLGMTGPVKATEVFRFAAPCAEERCQHFDGTDCRLAKKIVQLVPAVTEILPACTVRQQCRWWLQEGAAACRRCPVVVTENYQPSEELRHAADPTR